MLGSHGHACISVLLRLEHGAGPLENSTSDAFLSWSSDSSSNLCFLCIPHSYRERKNPMEIICHQPNTMCPDRTETYRRLTPITNSLSLLLFSLLAIL